MTTSSQAPRSPRRCAPPGTRPPRYSASLADLLGERHRIIAANWQNAGLSTLIGRLLRRAREMLDQVDFAPAAVREELAGRRLAPHYLYPAAELVDRAADLLAESAVLVHESERRWRVFRERVEALAGAGRGATAS